VKIYVAAVEALWKKEIWGQKRMKFNLAPKVVPHRPPPPPRLKYFFAGVFKNFTRFRTKLRVLMLCFPDFTGKL
jgi:hypothetical protein